MLPSGQNLTQADSLVHRGRHRVVSSTERLALTRASLIGCGMNDGKTVHVHEYTCAECGSVFQSDGRGSLAANNAGRAVYCSKQCRNKRNNAQPGKHSGTCPICSKEFRSRRKAKVYCSLQCFMKGPEAIARLQAQIQNGKERRGKCIQCEKQLRKGQGRFCGKVCYRLYLSERFDRFIASPETIALPQNFDEFLSQEELPCIINGCEWKGLRLGHHCNMVHGIPVEELRRLAGFNRNTGLVAMAESRLISERAAEMYAEGKIGQAFIEHRAAIASGDVDPSPQNPSNSLEATEHRRKAAAIQLLTVVEKTCKHCGKQFECAKISHNRKFCSVECRKASSKQTLNRARKPDCEK